MPTGAVVAVATLVECWRFDDERNPVAYAMHELAGDGVVVGDDEEDFGDYTPGRYGFALAHVRALSQPLPCRGMLGLWDVPAEIQLAIAERLA